MRREKRKYRSKITSYQLSDSSEAEEDGFDIEPVCHITNCSFKSRTPSRDAIRSEIPWAPIPALL